MLSDGAAFTTQSRHSLKSYTKIIIADNIINIFDNIFLTIYLTIYLFLSTAKKKLGLCPNIYGPDCIVLHRDMHL